RYGEADPLRRHKSKKRLIAGGCYPMRSIAFTDFLIGVGILFVLEGLMFAASPAWMRRAMKSALATPDNVLRIVGIVSAVVGLVLIWFVRRLVFTVISAMVRRPGPRVCTCTPG